MLFRILMHRIKSGQMDKEQLEFILFLLKLNGQVEPTKLRVIK